MSIHRLMASYFVGVDVGQKSDYTAVAVVQTEFGSFQVRHLARLPLNTPYTEVVHEVLALLSTASPIGKSQLVVDSTGVGLGVFDQFKKAGTTPIGITITSGKSIKRSGDIIRIPKRTLVTTLNNAINSARLKIPFCLRYCQELLDELHSFRVRVNKRTGHESYGAMSGAHDDLVMALAIAYLYAELASEVK